MSTEHQAFVRAVAPLLADLEPAADLYPALRQRRRRRRQLLSAGIAAGAVIAVASVAGTVIATRPPDRTAPNPVASPSTKVYVHPNGVRGSLGGDQKLLDAAGRLVRDDIDHPRYPREAATKPTEFRPVFAERLGSITVVSFVGMKTTPPMWITSWDVIRVGNGPLTLMPGGGLIYDPHNKAQLRTDTEWGQRTYGDPLWFHTVEAGGKTLLVLVVPQDVRAEFSHGLVVQADGAITRPFRPLELHAGTLLLEVSAAGPSKLRLSQGGRLVSHWNRNSTTQGGSFQADDSVYPTEAQMREQAAAARGHADFETVKQAAQLLGMDLQPFTGVPMRFRVLWGGTVGAQRCAMLAAQFDSGALLPSFICVDKRGVGSTTIGTVPAGTFERTSLAWSDGEHGRCAVLAVPGVVRAEFVYADSQTAPVALQDGYSVSPRAGKAVSVRLFDAAGNKVEERRVGEGVHPVN